MNRVIILLILSSIGSMAENIILDHNESEKIRKNLISTLEKVKKFKTKKNSQINNLQKKLKLNQRKFSNYQLEKEKEIKRLRNQLKQTKQALSQSKKILHSVKDKLEENKEASLTLSMNEGNEVFERDYYPDEIIPNGSEIETPWVEIVIEDDTNVYELAQKYYGDRNEYHQIYAVNKSRIGRGGNLNNGTPLIIPVTENFEDQPFILNSD